MFSWLYLEFVCKCPGKILLCQNLSMVFKSHRGFKYSVFCMGYFVHKSEVNVSKADNSVDVFEHVRHRIKTIIFSDSHD